MYNIVIMKLYFTLDKPGKCRQLGLSRKSKSLEKKVSVKETLMNFNFIR